MIRVRYNPSLAVWDTVRIRVFFADFRTSCERRKSSTTM